jgi:hypothetical protein
MTLGDCRAKLICERPWGKAQETAAGGGLVCDASCGRANGVDMFFKVTCVLTSTDFMWLLCGCCAVGWN